MRGKKIHFFVLLTVILCSSPIVHAFPDHEITGIAGGPPFNFGFTSDSTSFFLKSNRIMFATYTDLLAEVDLGYYALTDPQPYDISTDDDTTNDSPFTGAAYISGSDRVIVTQERGHALIYDMTNPTAEPTDVTVAEGKKLGTVVIDTTGGAAVIANNADRTLHVLNLTTLVVDATVTVTVPYQTSFTFTDGVFDSTVNASFFSTDKGAVVVLPSGGTAATIINVDTVTGVDLPNIAATPNGNFIYASNSTDTELVKIDASAQSIISQIDLTPNADLDDVTVANVTNPGSVYAYVGGSKGVSVVEVATDLVLDMGTGSDPREPIPTSAVPKRLVASSDGYVYMYLATTSVGIISANPWVSIISVVYSGGGSAMKSGESVTVTIQSSSDGTEEFRAGGDVDQSGNLLTDAAGNTSEPILANIDLGVEIPYDPNAMLFQEGNNDVFIFAKDAVNNVGRHAQIIAIDTPPPIVTLRSTGFGSGRIYIVFDRLTEVDMDHYNIYYDTDPDAVITKPEVGLAVTQPSEGDTVTGEIGGLVDGTTYYMAVEGVDQNGNVSPQRAYLLPDGSRASAIPQQTVGPVGYSGEKGCTLVQGANNVSIVGVVLLALTCFFLAGCSKFQAAGSKKKNSTMLSILELGTWNLELFRRTKLTKILFVLLCIVITLILPTSSQAERKESPAWWTFEVKGGFWMPQAQKTKRFFDTCCNIVTKLQGGLLIHKRYGIEQSVGFLYKSGDAIGAQTGETSMDTYNLILIPMDTSFAWRMDYWDWRYIIPYLKGGIDYILFREGGSAGSTTGIKYGAHGVAGLQVPLKSYFDDVQTLDQDFGINDISFTFEALYQWINNFGGGGLDLSGWIFSMGILFNF